MDAVARALGQLDSIRVANRIRDSADQFGIRMACAAREGSRRKRIQDACGTLKAKSIRLSKRIRPRTEPPVMEHVVALPLDALPDPVSSGGKSINVEGTIDVPQCSTEPLVPDVVKQLPESDDNLLQTDQQGTIDEPRGESLEPLVPIIPPRRSRRERVRLLLSRLLGTPPGVDPNQ